MSNISAMTGGSSADWSAVSSSRQHRQSGGVDANEKASDRKQKMFDKVDSDGSGSVDASELQTMIDKMSARAADNGDTAVTQALTGTDGKQLLSKMDSDGDGKVSADEFDAGMKSLMPKPDSTVDFAHHRGRPPEHPIKAGPDDSQPNDLPVTAVPPQQPIKASNTAADSGASTVSGASGAAATTGKTFDPLDTNQDGTVSASERAAGEMKALMSDLMKAVDSNGDGALSKSEAETFGKNVAAALEQATAAGASGSLSTSTSGAATDGTADGKSGHHGGHGGHGERDFANFAKLVLQQYQAQAQSMPQEISNAPTVNAVA